MIRSTPLCWLFVALNVVLVCTNIILSGALKNIEGRSGLSQRKEWEAELFALRRETAHLLAERTRLSTGMDFLDRMLRAGGSTPTSRKREEAEDSPSSVPKADGSEQGLATFNSLKMPLLGEEERRDLLRRRDAIGPVRPQDGPLLLGDVDALLRNPDWNPKGRILSAEEKEKLAHLLVAYRYYARTSGTDRIESMIKPAVAKMHEAGAYVEFPIGPGGLPPPVQSDGVTVLSVTDASPTPGYRRLFYFYPSEYPELYHQEMVEMERSLESYVSAYEVINGPLGSEE